MFGTIFKKYSLDYLEIKDEMSHKTCKMKLIRNTCLARGISADLLILIFFQNPNIKGISLLLVVTRLYIYPNFCSIRKMCSCLPQQVTAVPDVYKTVWIHRRLCGIWHLVLSDFPQQNIHCRKKTWCIWRRNSTLQQCMKKKTTKRKTSLGLFIVED